MKKSAYLISSILIIIFCTLICRSMTNQSAFVSENKKAAIKEALNKGVEDDFFSTKFFRRKPKCKIFGKQLLTMAKEDPYFFYIVDKKNLLPQDYTPKDLIGEGKYAVRSQTLQAFEKMKEAAKEEGINLWILSGFRPYERQQFLFERSVKTKGIEHADKYVARPGASQHQLGTAVDINSVENSFVNTKEYAWLKENAGKFGFSLSFPQGQENITGYFFEPWHYRYITPKGAEIQKNKFNDSQVDFLEALNACLK